MSRTSADKKPSPPVRWPMACQWWRKGKRKDVWREEKYLQETKTCHMWPKRCQRNLEQPIFKPPTISMRYVLPLRSTSFLIIGSHLRESRTGHLGSDPIIGANRVELVGVTNRYYPTLPYPTAVHNRESGNTPCPREGRFFREYLLKNQSWYGTVWVWAFCRPFLFSLKFLCSN